jgi:hypothetical protein
MTRKRWLFKQCLINNSRDCAQIRAIIGITGVPRAILYSETVAFREWCASKEPCRMTQRMVYAAMHWLPFDEAVIVGESANGIRDAARLAQCWAAMK